MAITFKQAGKVKAGVSNRRPTNMSKRGEAAEASAFEQAYPAIAQWVKSRGWIEIGQDEYSRSMVRALDEGGMVWEGNTRYASLDELLRALENGLTKWQNENGL